MPTGGWGTPLVCHMILATPPLMTSDLSSLLTDACPACLAQRRRRQEEWVAE